MMQQDESALSHFTSAIELDPNDPRPLHNRAAVYRRLQKFTQAAEDSAAAAALDPGDKATARCGFHMVYQVDSCHCSCVVACTCRLAAFAHAEVCAMRIQKQIRGRRARKELRAQVRCWTLSHPWPSVLA